MSPQMRSPEEEARNSKIALVLALILTGSFLVMGLILLFHGLTGRTPDTDDGFVATVLGLLLTLGGGVLVYNVFGEARTLNDISRRQFESPDQPWKWRADWAEGYATDELRKTSQKDWVRVLGWLLITILAIGGSSEQLARGNNTVRSLMGVILVIGAGFIVVASYRAIRIRRFRDLRLHLDQVPFRLGGRVSTTLDAGRNAIGAEGLEATLAFVHQWITHKGRSQVNHEEVLWSGTQTVAPAAVQERESGVRIPIRFSLPGGLGGTQDEHWNDRRFWRLEVRSAVPGVDLRAQFELPVWRG